jgi:lactate dehydrogenase-like 2-hydroxyacid dehydrogenase
MRARVFITQPVAARAIERLREVADVDLNADPLHIPTRDELLAAVRSHDILFCLLHDRIDRDVITANGKLRMVASRPRACPSPSFPPHYLTTRLRITHGR